MCSTVTLRPAGGSISVFHVPLNKNPAENETVGYLISDLFSEKQTSLLPSASLWHVWYYRKQHLSCIVLNQNMWKSACAFLHFKSVCQLRLKLIICVSCRLAFQAWLLLLVVCTPVVHLCLPSFCQQQLLWAQQADFHLTSAVNPRSPPSDLRKLKIDPFTWILASAYRIVKSGQVLEQ